MNGFLRILVYGAAALFLLFAIAVVVALASLRGKGVITPEKIRDYLISPEERTYIAAMRERKDEPPPVHAEPVAQAMDQERLLSDLAEMANAKHANTLVEELRRRKESLDERERWIETREAELRAARADLARLSRQLDQKRSEIADTEKRGQEERARFAQLQANEVQRTAALNEAEKARYKELAKLYELQKADAWQTLRKLEPKEVARILDQMDQKKAAALLKQAQGDPEYPMAVALHRELLTLNPTADSAAQVKRMAQLYNFLKADQIMSYLKGSTPAEIATIMQAMAEAGGPDKLRADLMAAISKEDEKRGRDVAAALKPANPQP